MRTPSLSLAPAWATAVVPTAGASRSSKLQYKYGEARTHARRMTVAAAAQEAPSSSSAVASSLSGRHSQQQRAGRSKQAPMPEPAAYQQTLRRSFTLGGIGLHTGEYAIIRVLPAFAGEGRYFVRVQPGTNSHLWELEGPKAGPLEEVGADVIAQESQSNSLNADIFFQYIESQEDGSFTGTFADFFQQRASTQPDSLFMEAELELLPEEEPKVGTPDEDRLPAHVSYLQQGHQWCSVLAHGDCTIWGAEHLLAALESCGVDNARIEVEGGKEVPVVDGSALGWAVEIQRAGLRPALSANGNDAATPRSIQSPHEVVTVRDGDAFITLYPGPFARVTVGVDCSPQASVIGRQWFTWSPDDEGYQPGDHFRWALAPARTVFPSAEAVRSLMDEGLLQGGPDYVSLIAQGDDWFDSTMLRFPSDEAARHAVIDLLGDLSLLANPGGRGLPTGHVVAYRATHALHAAFVQRLQAGIAAPNTM